MQTVEPLKIAEGNTVTMEYTLTLENGKVIDNNVEQEPLVFTLGKGELILGLEEALIGMQAGEKKIITVQPDKAYGDVKDDHFVSIALDKLPQEAKTPGVPVTAAGPGGLDLQGIVVEIVDKEAIVDFNHPLAGFILYFDITILDVQ